MDANVLTSPIQNQVLKEAEQLAESVGIYGLRRAAAIASAVGMSVKEAEIDSDGKLLFRDGAYHVLTRLGQTPTRSNFSIAHEVGHWLIYKVTKRVPDQNGVLEERRSDFKSRTEERLCDLVAAKLLMPQVEIERTLRSSPSEIEAVFPIARHFGVSKQAALIRILECLDRPGLLVRWRPFDYDRLQKGLIVDWVFRSPQEELRIYVKQIPTPKSVVEFYRSGAATRTVRDPFLKVAPPRESVQLIRMGREPYISIYALISTIRGPSSARALSANSNDLDEGAES